MARKTKRHNVHISKIILLLISNYFSAFAWGLFAPLFALVVIDRGGDATDVGVLWGSYTLLTGISMILFGKIEDSKHLVKKLLVLGIILQTVASITLLMFDHFNGLIISQFIFGIGFGMSMPALRAAYGSLLKKGKMASEWGFMDGGNMLIMSAAALIGGYVYQYSSPTTLYVLMSMVFGLSSLLFAITLKSLRKVL